MADLSGLPAALRRVIREAETPIGALSEAMAANNITIDQWREAMRAAIVEAFEAAGRSGAEIERITGEFQRTIDRLVEVQIDFLDNFAGDIDTNGWLGPYDARALMYASAAKQAYWHGDVLKQAGRFLPLPAMPAEGTQCLSNCKCQWRVETINADEGDYDAYWERHAEDSCQTCLERRALWYPVRIRGGELLR